MSKFSEYLEAWRSYRNTEPAYLECRYKGSLIAYIDSVGDLQLAVTALPNEQALTLAKWILEVYGE